MKRIPLTWFSVAALLTLCFSVQAAGAIDMTVLPVIVSRGVPCFPVPLQIKLENVGQSANGTVVVGSAEEAVTYPFHIGVKQKLSFVAYCPSYIEQSPTNRSSTGTDLTNSVDVELKANSEGSGPSLTRQKLNFSQWSRSYLLISDSSGGIDYLTESKMSLSMRKELVQKSKSNHIRRADVQISFVQPKLALNRAYPYHLFPIIVLGRGTRNLSNLQVACLKEYLLGGGTLVFSTATNSAELDSRWANLMPAKGKSRYFAFGFLTHVSFDVQQSVKIDEALRQTFLSSAVRPIPSNGFLTLGADLAHLSQQPVKFGYSQDKSGDPFRSSLPSFQTVALSLAAYLFLVVPFNFVLLRKIRKPELMWISAPLLAVGFATFIFKSSSKLGRAPASVTLTGGLTSAPESQRELLSGDFTIFSPKASEFNLAVKNSENLSEEVAESDFRMIHSLVPITDTGVMNVPDYRSSNLQFKRFSSVEDPSSQSRILFSVGKPERGIYPITATNIGNQTISNVTFIAGRYSWSGRTLLHGQSLKIMTAEVKPLAKKRFDEFLHASNVGTGQLVELLEMAAQVQNQVALFGIVEDLPFGPNLTGPHQFHSKIQLATFAPLDLKLP